MPLYNLRIIREGVFAVFVSFVFFLLVMFPNIPLGLEQVKRTCMGYDALSETYTPLLEPYVDQIERSGDPPDWYIDEQVPYASDFELWGNMDYWETPEEVIKKGRTDCDGKAILTKAVLDIVHKRALLKKTERVPVISEIKHQQQHVYVEVKKQENKTGTQVNTTVAYYKIPEEPEESFLDKIIKGLKEFHLEVPGERQILLCAGYSGIWTHYLLRIRKIHKEERKKKKLTAQTR
jgi:hypothetical protein